MLVKITKFPVLPILPIFRGFESTYIASLKSFSQKKKIISHVNEINNNHPPDYFSHGDRTLNILHTKLRLNCILNCDLHRYNIIDSPLCTCGKIEDTYHYLFFLCQVS